MTQAAEALHLMLVIIIIMTNEKRQAKNFLRPHFTIFPTFEARLSALEG
jgi:hypothetical protein